MPLYGVDVPPEYRGNPHFKRAGEVMQPLLARLARKPPPPALAPAFLTGLLFALAGPLVAYLGRPGAMRAAEQLLEALAAGDVRQKH